MSEQPAIHELLVKCLLIPLLCVNMRLGDLPWVVLTLTGASSVISFFVGTRWRHSARTQRELSSANPGHREAAALSRPTSRPISRPTSPGSTSDRILVRPDLTLFTENEELRDLVVRFEVGQRRTKIELETAQAAVADLQDRLAKAEQLVRAEQRQARLNEARNVSDRNGVVTPLHRFRRIDNDEQVGS